MQSAWLNVIKSGRAIGAVLLLAVLGLLAWLDFGGPGAYTVRSDFRAEFAEIRGLLPSGRVQAIANGANGYRLVGEPVYFDVRLPQAYRQALVAVDYLTDGDPHLRVGVQEQPDQWQFQMASIADHGPAVFALRTGQRDPDGFTRFTLSAPGVDFAQTAVVVRSVEVVASERRSLVEYVRTWKLKL